MSSCGIHQIVKFIFDEHEIYIIKKKFEQKGLEQTYKLAEMDILRD
jgi:hypothetical protein